MGSDDDIGCVEPSRQCVFPIRLSVGGEQSTGCNGGVGDLEQKVDRGWPRFWCFPRP